MWDEIENYLNNLDLPYKLYVNLPYETDGNNFLDFQWETYVNYYQDLKNAGKNNNEKAYKHFIKHGLNEGRFYRKDHLDVYEKIIKFKNDTKVFLSPNRGVDIGGFLYTYKKIDNDTDLILKIHTKKGLGSEKVPSLDLMRRGGGFAISHGRNWFHGLMGGVLSNSVQVNNIINNFTQDSTTGMVGFRKYKNFTVNYDETLKILSKLNVKKIPENSDFIGGTIFWVRNEILKKYLSNNIINEIIELMPYGYVREPSINHAMERVFGILVYFENKNIKIIK
jgi:lipopolysaccharide biosynthesis protein